jgi:ribonuclease R
LERVPGCGRRGEAHRGRGHGGAPTSTEKRTRDGGGEWRRRSGVHAAWGRGKRGSAGAQMREGERMGEAMGSSGRGRGSCELHARRGRGDRGTRSSGGGYAGTRELTARAREQRERGSECARGESGCADGRARQGRERRGGRRARGMGLLGRKAEGGTGVWASFLFLLF